MRNASISYATNDNNRKPAKRWAALQEGGTQFQDFIICAILTHLEAFMEIPAITLPMAEAMANTSEHSHIVLLAVFCLIHNALTGVGSIMCSYNRINDTYACENQQTLTADLKGTMGFQVCRHYTNSFNCSK